MPEQERDRRTEAPLGAENAAMPQDEDVSEIGDIAAMKRSIAIEQANDLESGGLQEQEDYLRWERRMDREAAAQEEDGR